MDSMFHRTSIRKFEDKIDMAIAQENMWLETDSIGLGGVWLPYTGEWVQSGYI